MSESRNPENVVSSFEQPLSAMERLTLHMPNANVVLAARIRRVITQGEIERALPALRDRHPLLAVRVELGDRSRAFFSASGVDLPEVAELGGGEMTQAVAQELRQAFSWERGPLMRLRLIPEEGHTVLLVCAHHAICDGLSLFFVLRDLVEWVELGRFMSPDPIAVAIQDSAPIPHSSWGERIGLRLMSKRWRRSGTAFSSSNTEELHERFWSEHSIHMHMEQLARDETEAFIAACRDQSITVGTALTVACLKAQTARQSNSTIGGITQVTVSFRNRLHPPATEALGFYATRVRVPFEFDEGRTVWQNASSFGTALSNHLSDETVFSIRRLERLDPGLIDALAFAGGGLCDDRLAKRLVHRMGTDRVISGLRLANLGRPPQPEANSAEILDAVFGPFVATPRSEKYIAAATIGGRLHLSMSHDEATLPTPEAQSFFHDAIQEIRRMSA